MYVGFGVSEPLHRSGIDTRFANDLRISRHAGERAAELNRGRFSLLWPHRCGRFHMLPPECEPDLLRAQRLASPLFEACPAHRLLLPCTFLSFACASPIRDDAFFAIDRAFSEGKSRLDILRHGNEIQFSDKPLLRYSQTLREEKESFPSPESELRETS
jgi:hypothetical protein